MSAQRVHTVLLLAAGLAACAVHCSQFRPERAVPARCRQAASTPVSCANTHLFDNLLPHPDDCELFYYCVTPTSQPICRQCPARLHFNPRLHVCDFPAVAGCRAPATTAAPTTAADVDTDTSSSEGTTVEPTGTTTDEPATTATWDY